MHLFQNQPHDHHIHMPLRTLRRFQFLQLQNQGRIPVRPSWPAAQAFPLFPDPVIA